MPHRLIAVTIFAVIITVSHAAEPAFGSPDFHPAPDHPVGWRGDGTGRYPAATPPLEWYRRPKGAFNFLRVQAERPKDNKPLTLPSPGGRGETTAGELLNMGSIREWLVAGPFDAKEHKTALEDVSQPDETTLQPALGEALGGKPWKLEHVSIGNQSQSWARLVLDLALLFGKQEQQEWQNHPGTLDPLVAYACTNIYAPEAMKVLLRIGGTHPAVWVNGKPVKVPGQWDPSPAVELNAGWNRLMVKAASSKSNWNISALITPAPNTGYETKNIVWMAPIPGQSWSSPIVVGSKLFVTADDGTMVCLNKADGRALWTHSTTFFHCISNEEREKFPALAPKVQQLDELMKTLPDILNAGLSVDGSKADGNAALQKKIKEKLELERSIRETMGKADKVYDCWGNDRSWAMATPVSDGKHVWAAFYGGNKGKGANAVVCFDLDGKVVWNHFTGQTGIGEHGQHTTPCLSGNNLVYLSGGTLFCYEKETGNVVWQKKTKFGGVAGASTVALKAGATDVVLMAQEGIFRLSDGVELWKSDLTNSIVTPFNLNGTIYGVADGGNVMKLYAYKLPAPAGDTLKPDIVFKKPWKEIGLNYPGQFTNQIIGPPLVHDGLYYAVTEGGGLAVLDAATGAPIYTKMLDALNPRLTWVFSVGICSGPTLAGNAIHIRDDQSQTLVLAPGREYKELAKNVLWELQPSGAQQEAQSTPVYEGGRIYYRTQFFLYCIGEK
ncbi:MAG TPA: PQQ-binding-like beta-propeller repeat protein [Planctomycetota bacterium]|nr:PQQ-binding-like beta-propeller repeat protein [Planctomycetota bacterium]